MSSAPKRPSSATSDRTARPHRPERRVVEAGGMVLWRIAAGRLEFAVVHRPRYDDWSFPKGKRDADDPDLLACALREVREETGHTASAGPFIAETRYPVTTKKNIPATKSVTYWLGQVTGGAFRANPEVDRLRWVGRETAEGLLTHAVDREVLAAAAGSLARQLSGILQTTVAPTEIPLMTATTPPQTASADIAPTAAAAAIRAADTAAASGRPELTHLAVSVADLDATIRFHARYTGLIPIHSRDDRASGVRIAWLADPYAGPGGLVLVCAQGLSAMEPIGPFAHLGFACRTRAEVDTIAARGISDGICILEPTDAGPIVGYICEVRDPDGNVCEFSFGQSLGRHGVGPVPT